MKRTLLAGLTAAFLMGSAPAANAAELIVYHGWSTPSEVGALNVLRDSLEAKGHSWKDLAIPHNSGVNVSIVNMVTGGEPPNAFVNSDPGIFRDLAGMGLERDLTGFYDEIGATENFFPIIRELSTVDGKMVKVPLFMHIDGMVYWNKEVAAKAGVDPAKVRQALMGGLASSRILEVHGERMIKRTFDPGFRIELHQKDLNLALEGAKAMGMSLPNTASTQQLFSACVANGGAGWDHSGLVKALELMAGKTVG